MDQNVFLLRIRKKLADAQTEAEDLEDRAAAARVRIATYQDILGLAEYPDNHSKVDGKHEMKPASHASKARAFLKERGHPGHLNDIVKSIGLLVNTKSKGRVSSQLNKYVRDGRLFTRPSPGMYGLIEWDNPSQVANTNLTHARLNEET